MKKWFLLCLGVGLMASCQSQKSEIRDQNAVMQSVSNSFAFTEGPATAPDGNVYFTDQPNNKIYFWDWRSNEILMFSNQTGRANGTYFDANGNLITCSDENGEIWKFAKDGSHEVLLSKVDGKRLNGPNDLWIDSSGGIYFTDPLYERDYWENFKQEIPTRNLYYRDAKGVVAILDQFTQPNGIVGNPKSKKLYVSDIDAGKTYVYDILGNGKIGNKKEFVAKGSDGMTLDENGNLYLTGKGVYVYNSKGEYVDHIPVPMDWTANLTFGGKDRNILFITASQSVYILQMKVKGLQ